MSVVLASGRQQQALQKAVSALLAEYNPGGYWTGALSSSALSTAVATVALAEMVRAGGAKEDLNLVRAGLSWLAAHANPDGGWGDTVRSQSNISTTALAWAAFGAGSADGQFGAVVGRAEHWLCRSAGSKEALPSAIAAAYGKDRTFSVPILMTLALSGRFGPNGWRHVPALPFELAALPRRWFAALQLPVVSYALPALIAIGQTIHVHAPCRNRPRRWLRTRLQARTLGFLHELQPSNGGFLEATPLTSFVTMSLASMGVHTHAVARSGAAFLRASVRPDGSWPIDTNLATWLTTTAVTSLHRIPGALSQPDKTAIRGWLLQQQFQQVHPYTGAAPGAWAWTDLPGGVPDADDTAGALLALHRLSTPDPDSLRAAEKGVNWLLDLQNRDGGMPTFCRGWGALPFDRSAPELTVHGLRAWTTWRPHLAPRTVARINRAIPRAFRYLAGSQRADGAWVPLWFGNEHAALHENPVYGTAQTLIGLNELAEAGVTVSPALCAKATAFLCASQGPTGGWGGDATAPESIEETALAVEALAGVPAGSGSLHGAPDTAGTGPAQTALSRGVERLVELVEAEGLPTPAPIGLYFARLWYFERLYPILFATSALARLCLDQP